MNGIEGKKYFSSKCSLLIKICPNVVLITEAYDRQLATSLPVWFTYGLFSKCLFSREISLQELFSHQTPHLVNKSSQITYEDNKHTLDKPTDGRCH